MGADRMIGQLPSYTGKVERIEVCKTAQLADEKIEMLVSFGFDCLVEKHCGFWLVHWKFPELKSVKQYGAWS